MYLNSHCTHFHKALNLRILNSRSSFKDICTDLNSRTPHFSFYWLFLDNSVIIAGTKLQHKNCIYLTILGYEINGKNGLDFNEKCKKYENLQFLSESTSIWAKKWNYWKSPLFKTSYNMDSLCQISGVRRNSFLYENSVVFM